MNMQAMLKQAQKMQKDMLNTQDEINKKVFEYSSGIVSAKMTGDYKLVELKIKEEQLDKEDIEMLEDMIVVVMDNLIKQIKDETETKMGAYTKGMPGLF